MCSAGPLLHHLSHLQPLPGPLAGQGTAGQLQVLRRGRAGQRLRQRLRQLRPSQRLAGQLARLPQRKEGVRPQ